MPIDEDWTKSVLDFWFEELQPTDWFDPDDALDEKIRARFMGLSERLGTAPSSLDASDWRTALAAILVLDQFPRNMFRRQPRAFATDNLATEIARKAVERGYDREAPEGWRPFFYMPLMHSENVADQEHCVSLCSALAGDTVKYAIEHRDIIARFGRFPHRNSVLGRESTEAEKAFLSQHKGFGQ